VRGFRSELVIREVYERPARPRRTAEEKAGPWRARRIPDPVPTGRIQLSLGQDGRSWADGTSWTLEDKLGEVFAEIETQAAADAARLAERERERTASQASREKAMAIAGVDFVHDQRRDDFADQLHA
jgi:hypothetical protein